MRNLFVSLIPGLFIVLMAGLLSAETVEYDLTIERTSVDIAGKDRTALTINGGIPAPVIEFTEGDDAVLHVHNRLAESTSIHWHGLLVPPDMDGVPYITFPPIEAGETFTYRFPIRQSGTYWYHSHSGLQEQEGMYGAIVIHPRKPLHRADHDVAVVLSDWSNESPREIIRTLKRGSEWYGIRKGSAISLSGAVKFGMLGDYFRRELVRMPEMDISDVYYDRFLANGRPEIFIDARPGDTVRLRLIDGSASTFFHTEFAGDSLTIITADGLPVEPVKEKRLLIGVAETYDVLVTVPAGGGAWELRATAHDSTGHASVWIGDGNGPRHPAPDVPLPNLYYSMGRPTMEKVFAFTPAGTMGMPDREVDAGRFDQPGANMEMGGSDRRSAGHGGMEMAATGGGSPMDMDMSGAANRVWRKDGRRMVVDAMHPERPTAPYSRLRALRSTAPDPSKPVQEVRLTLDGDMERYTWFLNNKPLAESDSIKVERGKVARFIMINRTMMYHPMHLHGQFFRVINGQGDRAPLKHTVMVEPMTTTVFEFEASEVGDWFFHCHLLYHMHSGMARVVHYRGFTPAPDVQEVRHELYRDDEWYFYGASDFLSHMTEGALTTSNIRFAGIVGWEIGWNEVEETEYEIDLLANYYENRFLSFFAGAELTNSEAYPDARAVFGFRYPLPFLIETASWVDSEGEFRFGVGKSYPITSRLHLFGELEYDTRTEYEWSAGLEYRISKKMSLTGNYHSEFGTGGGVSIRF